MTAREASEIASEVRYNDFIGHAIKRCAERGQFKYRYWGELEEPIIEKLKKKQYKVHVLRNPKTNVVVCSEISWNYGL